MIPRQIVFSMGHEVQVEQPDGEPLRCRTRSWTDWETPSEWVQRYLTAAVAAADRRAASCCDQQTLDMPAYRSHKRVTAAPIDHVEHRPDGRTIVFVRLGDVLRDVEVSDKLFARGEASPGDYLVRYEDGYVSWCPKVPFEAGNVPERGAVLQFDGIHLRTERRSPAGQDIVVSVQIGDRACDVIREFGALPDVTISHFVSPLGIGSAIARTEGATQMHAGAGVAHAFASSLTA